MLSSAGQLDPGQHAGPDPFRPGRGSRPLRGFVERILLCFGGAALTTSCLCGTVAALYQWYQGVRLDRAVERARSLETTSPLDASPVGPVLRETRVTRPHVGLPFGRIEFPRLRTSAIVVEGSDARSLLIAVGHLPGTALPGENGNIVVAGHRDTFFRPLRHIRSGDEIRLVTPQGQFVYRVAWSTIVPPERTDLLAPTSTPALTLVTCYPFNWIGTAPLRFVVRALPAATEQDSASRARRTREGPSGFDGRLQGIGGSN